MKRLLGFMGVAILGLTVVGCGNQDDTDEPSEGANVTVHREGFPIVDEPITMSIMGPGVGLRDWEEMPFFQVYSEMTNIHFEFTHPPINDFATNLNLAFASRDLPDILFGAGNNDLTRAMEIDYGSQGLLIPLEDLIEEYAPNLSKVLDENPDVRRNITSPDGHIYSLPVISIGGNSIWPHSPAWYNGSWLEALEVEEVPKTIDEFFDLMVRFRDEEPAGPGVEVYPISDGNQLQWLRRWLLSGFGLTTVGIEVIDDVVQYNATTDNYRAYLEWMHQLWEENILDREIFSQSGEQVKAKGNNNQVGFFLDWFPNFTTGEDEIDAMKNPMFYPLTSEWSEERVVNASPGMSTGTFAITSEAKNPAAAMRWVDYFYSEEGALFANHGPEGYLWEYQTNDAGEQVRVFTEDVDLTDTEADRGKVTPYFGIQAPGIGFELPPILENANDEPDNPFWEWILAETEEKITPYAKVPFPPAALKIGEADAISIISTDLNTFLTESEARFITGVDPINDETWEEFVNTLESIGSQVMVETYQAVYDRWSAME